MQEGKSAIVQKCTHKFLATYSEYLPYRKNKSPKISSFASETDI